MTTLHDAAQQALAFTMRDFATMRDFRAARAVVQDALRDALAQQGRGQSATPLEQQAEPTVKESLQVPPSIADAMTAADLAWLETRRLVRVWEELGQMRWAGADEGWDKAIEKVRNRLDKECQDVLAWKERVEASGETAVQLLQRMKHD